MNQEPLPMESCEPPAALNVLPWPVATPKNRVGGSPVFSFVFAFQYIGQTLDTPAENGGCAYDFASGVHKYLYAADDPVDNVDPSGHDISDIEFFLSSFSYLVSMSLPETGRLLESAFSSNQHGFKYEMLVSKYTNTGVPRSSMSTGAIVESAAGVNEFKNDAANFGKSKGDKILRLELFGHGDPNATVGTAGYAQLALGDKIQSPFNNELMGGDFGQLFNGRFWSDAEIDLEFCHSLDVPQIPQLFKNLAPNAQIWGVHGEQNGIGEYGPIENLVKY